MNALDEARRLLEANYHIAVSNPEWRRIVGDLVVIIDKDKALLAHFRKAIDQGVMKEVGHSELAGQVRMLTRSDLKHEVIVTAARDRILWLADKVALQTAALGIAQMTLEQGGTLDTQVAANGPTVREVIEKALA
jgi:hypothetical protein